MDYDRLHSRQGRFKHTMLHRSDLMDTVKDVIKALGDAQP